MRWRTTRWKVCTTKCSSENIALLCRKNPPWQRRSPARGNYWNAERNRVGCRARLGDDNTLRFAVGERGKWSGGRRGAHSNSQPERNAAASRRRKPAAFAAHARLQLVTSARFAERNGRGREGEGATGSPWSVAIGAVVTA